MSNGWRQRFCSSYKVMRAALRELAFPGFPTEAPAKMLMGFLDVCGGPEPLCTEFVEDDWGERVWLAEAVRPFVDAVAGLSERYGDGVRVWSLRLVESYYALVSLCWRLRSGQSEACAD